MVLASVTEITAQTVDVPPATLVARLVKFAIEDSSLGARRADVRNFYAPAGYQPVWSRNGLQTPQARAMMTLFANAAEKGLEPADYALPSGADIAHFDVAMTAAAMRYASDLHQGRIDPRDFDFAPYTTSPAFSLPPRLTTIRRSSDPATVIASVEPQSDNYRGLLAALATYRRIAVQSQGEQPLPVVDKVKPGDAYAALPQLATMLRRAGDLAPDAKIDARVYDGAIVDGVKTFQSRHGLAADGVLSKKTFAELNVPASRRVQQIEWAIERSRWISTDGASIVVNIPEFRLLARDTNGATLAMNVVVGKAAGHKTPLLEGDVRNVVVAPTWGVPDDIQRNEIVPKLQRNANWLATHNFEIVDDDGQSYGTAVDSAMIEQLRTLHLRVRQKPGTSNALGLVKFLFP